MRLFVAVTVPDPVLDLVQALPRPDEPTLRWTTREQWHVTLRFLGSVEDPAPVADELAAVPAAVRRAGHVDVEAVLGPASAWFDGRRILQVPVCGLDALADAVAGATSPWGEPSSKAYVGHLTLARVRGRGRGDARLAGNPIEASWPVDAFALMSSQLGRGGARYETQATVAL